MVESWCYLEFDGMGFDSEKIVSATFSDKAGNKSDQLSVTLIPSVPRPKPATKVTFLLANSAGEVLPCGTFYVQSVTRSKNESLRFTATSVEFSEKQKKKYSKHYKDTTLKSIVEKVSSELGHTLKFEAPDVNLKSFNQTDETHISFLDRLAKEYDILFSIKNNIVYFVSKSWDELPKYSVLANQCSSSQITRSTKTFYKSCIIRYRDRKKAKWNVVQVGTGTPVLEIKCECQSEQEARIKAQNALYKMQRGTVRGTLTTIGQKVYAGTHLDLKETFDNEDDGVYFIESASHKYTHKGGWVASLEFENFKLKKKGNNSE